MSPSGLCLPVMSEVGLQEESCPWPWPLSNATVGGTGCKDQALGSPGPPCPACGSDSVGQNDRSTSQAQLLPKGEPEVTLGAARPAEPHNRSGAPAVRFLSLGQASQLGKDWLGLSRAPWGPGRRAVAGATEDSRAEGVCLEARGAWGPRGSVW